MEIDMRRLVPAYLLRDRNGAALAAAIGRAMQLLCETADAGLSRLSDIDTMPEWRLDELAWEYDCLYDYDADIAAKRGWIREAASGRYAPGTPGALRGYLTAAFEGARITEGPTPYHFSVGVSGAWNEAARRWLESAVSAAKNTRSAFDGYGLFDTAECVCGTYGAATRYETPVCDGNETGINGL